MELINITSTQNQFIKNTRLLHQSKISRIKGQFIVEGLRLFSEALKAGIIFDMVFATKEFLKSSSPDQSILINKIFIVSEKLMSHISQLETPPGILGVAEREFLKKNALKFNKNEFFLVLENLQDPGNLGVILRTAGACGIKKVILSSNSVDVYNNKVIRASAGAVFYQEIYYFNDLLIELRKIKKQGVRLIATSSKAKESIFNFSFKTKKPTCIILGSEAHGVSSELIDLSDACISIPLFGDTESFNVAVACGVILYEIIRQTGRES